MFTLSVFIAAASMALPAKILLILGIILLILAVIVGIVAFLGAQNAKIMNQTIDDALADISKSHTVTEISCDEYEEITIYGVLKFHVKQYQVENIGNLSVMKVNMGFMQMATMVLNPDAKALPMISVDYMYKFSNRTCYIEFYDFVPDKADSAYQELLEQLSAVKASYSNLEDAVPTPAWYDTLKTVGIYKNGTKENDAELTKMLTESLNVCLTHADLLPELDEQDCLTKHTMTVDYTEGLITKGGISTDVFKKALGEDTTRDFFRRVLFGTGE